MSVKMQFDGLDELKREFAKLPQDLRDEGMGYVREATEESAADVKALYAQHTRSGNLARGVRVEYPSSTIAVGIVKSNAQHAHLFEWGSELRETAGGANRGRMPAAGTNGAVPIYQRKRRRMNEQLVAMVQREGFVVTGA